MQRCFVRRSHRLALARIPFEDFLLILERMEVVLAVTIVSQGAAFVVETLQNRLGAEPDACRIPGRNRAIPSQPTSCVSNASPHPVSDSERDEALAREPEFIDANAHEGSATDIRADEEVDITPETVESLERQVALLRENARVLNSPDTLVQWARTTREADAVEARLNRLKGLLGDSMAHPRCFLRSASNLSYYHLISGISSCTS